MAEKEAHESTNAEAENRQQSIDAHLATLLTQKFQTRGDLFAAVKWSSSLQGCRAVTEKRHSGGSAVVITCCSRENEISGDNVVCTMRVVGRKSSRKKPWVWAIREGTKVSSLKHIPGCPGICKVTQPELMANKVFVNTILSNKFTATKTIAEILTGVGMPFHGLKIPIATIYRARQRILASDPEYNRVQLKRVQRRKRSMIETIPSNMLLHISSFLMAVTLSRLVCVSRSFQTFEKRDAEVVHAPNNLRYVLIVCRA